MQLTSALAAAVCGATTATNIVELAVSVPGLSTLVTTVTAGKLVSVLESPGPFTVFVFAPTNERLAQMVAKTNPTTLAQASFGRCAARNSTSPSRYSPGYGRMIRARTMKMTQTTTVARQAARRTLPSATRLPTSCRSTCQITCVSTIWCKHHCNI